MNERLLRIKKALLACETYKEMDLVEASEKTTHEEHCELYDSNLSFKDVQEFVEYGIREIRATSPNG